LHRDNPGRALPFHAATHIAESGRSHAIDDRFTVPELTRNACIQLNERVSLRRRTQAIACGSPGLCLFRLEAAFHDRKQSRHYSFAQFAAGAGMGRNLAPLDGHYSTPIDYRPARIWQGLATL
jgi:hypothetical protein